MECGIRTAECGILTEDEDNAAWRTANWEYAEGLKDFDQEELRSVPNSAIRNPHSIFRALCGPKVAFYGLDLIFSP